MLREEKVVQQRDVCERLRVAIRGRIKKGAVAVLGTRDPRQRTVEDVEPAGEQQQHAAGYEIPERHQHSRPCADEQADDSQ